MTIASQLSITRLTPRHLKILDYCVEGLTPKDISQKLGMQARQIGLIINSGGFQHQLAIRRKKFTDDVDQKLAETEVQAAEVLKSNSKDAAKALAFGLKSNSENIRLRSAEAILDRSGNPRNIRSVDDNNKTIINISKDDLLLLKETLQLENNLHDKINNGLNPKIKEVTNVEK